MYCSQCGKDIPKNSKFCANCGFPISEEETKFDIEKQLPHDAVEDITQKLKRIDNRRNTKAKKDGVIKSAIKTIKKEVSVFDLVFGDDFDEKKLADKKQLIMDYPIPSSPESLANFAKYINSMIASKKKKTDALSDTWKEKLKQVYSFAKKEMRTTEAFAEIKQYYKAYRRRERRIASREYLWWLLLPIFLLFACAFGYQLPLLLFAAIVALGWEVFLLLYVYDLLDKMIASIRQHCTKRNGIPKILRVVMWYSLVPALAGLITSIAYLSIGFIILAVILFATDAFFLMAVLGAAYNW